MQELISPYSFKYEGLLAKDHKINAHDLGWSIVGASKLSTSIVHYVLYGYVPKGNYSKQFECLSLPHKEGSYEWIMSVVPVAAEIVSYPDFYKAGVSHAYSLVWGAITKILTRKNVDIEKMADAIISQNETMQVMAESLRQVENNRHAESMGMQKLMDHLVETLGGLAAANKSNAINYVSPVGKSCSTINQYFGSTPFSSLNEGDAEIIRQADVLNIGKSAKYRCTQLTELNIETGHCELIVDGFEKKITGIIVDPAIKSANNTYSSALDNHTALMLTAKPELANGEVKRLHVLEGKIDAGNQ